MKIATLILFIVTGTQEPGTEGVTFNPPLVQTVDFASYEACQDAAKYYRDMNKSMAGARGGLVGQIDAKCVHTGEKAQS